MSCKAMSAASTVNPSAVDNAPARLVVPDVMFRTLAPKFVGPGVLKNCPSKVVGRFFLDGGSTVCLMSSPAGNTFFIAGLSHPIELPSSFIIQYEFL